MSQVHVSTMWIVSSFQILLTLVNTWLGAVWTKLSAPKKNPVFRPCPTNFKCVTYLVPKLSVLTEVKLSARCIVDLNGLGTD